MSLSLVIDSVKGRQRSAAALPLRCRIHVTVRAARYETKLTGEEAKSWFYLASLTDNGYIAR